MSDTVRNSVCNWLKDDCLSAWSEYFIWWPQICQEEKTGDIAIFAKFATAVYFTIGIFFFFFCCQTIYPELML